MKKLFCLILGTVLVVSLFGQEKGTETFFYQKGRVWDVEIHQSFGQDYWSNYFLNVSAGYGYRLGNGLDYSIVMGWDQFSPMGQTVQSYVQFRYHLFDSKLSPFVSVGAGMNYYIWTDDCAPTLRGAIGMSLGQLSMSFSYVESWIAAGVDEKVYKRLGSGLPTLCLTYSF